MDIKLERLNAMPIRTWRRLGVNDTSLTFAFPADTGRLAREPVITLPEELAPLCVEPESFGGFVSAVGAESENFTRGRRNAGLCIRAPQGVRPARPAAARYVLGGGDALYDCNCIVAEAGSRVDVVVLYGADGAGGPAFHGGLTRVIAGRCSRVRFASVQMLGDGAAHMSDFAALTEAGASVEYTQIELGAAKVVSGCHIDLRGADSSVSVNTFYFGDGERTLDFNNIVRHSGERTKSEMKANGALFGSAGKVYRGTLDFVRGSRKAVGSETENTLLFSPDARNRSAPLILCGEEDVDGRHAATIGRLDDAELFYMLSRGLTEMEAKRLVASSLLGAAMRSVGDERLRKAADKFLSERIKQKWST
ncbi:MAG: SufD family Fe-S cluster assembly protein [Oscillospiraceae bacterium]|jgi:Fe-S cluster assembly scaffold protein SufB|nr:SufD family Fe-S cluster assembly protein [Oscillospiraceae bacterium]